MKFCLKISFLFLCVFGVHTLQAQSQRKLEYEAQKNLIIEQSIEILAANLEDEDADFTTLFDVLSSYFDKPINLNNKEILEDLKQLTILSDYQINNLIEHINKNGNLMSIYELQAVPGWDIQSIRNVMPFVTVNSEFYSPKASPKELFKNASNELFIRYTRVLEPTKGYDEISDEDWLKSNNKHYLGSPDKLYMRYRFKYLTNLSIGITAEKDAGETFFGNKRAEDLFGIKTQKGFDFYSAHFFIKNVGFVKQLAVGDYQAQFGQGLTFWSGLAFGKSINILTAKKNARGLRPYTSVDENSFLRGAGATIGIGEHIEFTAFGSRKQIDANITLPENDSIDNLDNITISSFQATGQHATVGELADKDALTETITGARAAFKSRKLNIGVMGVNTIFDGNVERTLQPYAQFQLNTNQNTVVGADYSLILKNFNFFGEGSRSANGGTAFMSGFLASLTPTFNLVGLYRNYGKDFQNRKSVAFAESSQNVNEKGLFLGADAKINKAWTISTYFDQFEFPWMRYQTDKPNTNGFDGVFQLRYKPSRSLDMYVRYRGRTKPINTDAQVSDIPNIVEVDKDSYKFNVIFKVSKSLRLQSRIEYNTYKRGGSEQESGFLLFQDINFKPLSSPFSFSFRYAIFDTDSYNSRIYAYENDVLYYFGIPSYSGRGTRTYLTARYKIRKGVDFWLRYAQWFYNDSGTIGSSLNTIEGNRKSEVRALLVFRF